MSNYRRAHTPGASWFFTVNLANRHGNDLLVRRIDLLRACVAYVKSRHPFRIDAWVVLPEHMHWMWTLPVGDADFPVRWRLVKARFSRQLPQTEYRSAARRARGERGIWQRRYWEHQIRNAEDMRRHMDYVHINPVKHGWTTRVVDWPHSSFHAWAAKGVYPADWAGDVGLQDRRVEPA